MGSVVNIRPEFIPLSRCRAVREYEEAAAYADDINARVEARIAAHEAAKIQRYNEPTV